MTFIWVSEDSRTLVAGTAGYTSRADDTLRGHSLYVSYDGGESFTPLCQPESPIIPDSKMNGLVAPSAADCGYRYIPVSCRSC